MNISLPRPRSIQRTTCIMVFCLGVLLGLGLARAGWYFVTWPLLVLCCIAVVSVHRRRWLAVIVVMFCGVWLGCLRGGVYMDKLDIYTTLYGHEVTLEATVDNDASYDGSQVAFTVTRVHVQHPVTTPLVGRLSIKAVGLADAQRGDRLRIYGKLYKTRGSSQAAISFARAQVLTHPSNRLNTIRLDFAAGVRNAVPEPQASFGLGLLVGQKTSLPKQITDSLSAVGLTHIIAVSGYNLTIIVEFARSRLGKRSKYQAAVWAVVLMALFVGITGFSASIIRAVIVSMLGLSAWYYGRTVRPMVLILLTASATALWYPPYVWSDIGWYLSFLAFFGVLVLAPLIVRARRLAGQQTKTLGMLITESVAAQFMTIPIIMFVFHRFSIIGLLANIIVVPLVPLAMLAVLIAGVAGGLAPALAGWFGVPAQLMLSYMLQIASYLARWQHAVAQQAIDAKTMLAMYGVLLIASAILWRLVTKNATITDIETSED